MYERKIKHALVDGPLLYKFTNRAVFGAYFMSKGGISYCGKENIGTVDDGPYILASIHRAMIDPAIIANTLLKANGGQVHFMAKEELWKEAPGVVDMANILLKEPQAEKVGKIAAKLAGWFISTTGAFPVDRLSGQGLEQTAQHIHDLAENNGILGIFPEGGLKFVGNEVGILKKGVGYIALKHHMKIIPVGISGAEKTKNKKRGPLHVVYGDPIYPPDVTITDDTSLRDINELLNTMRGTVHYGMQKTQDTAVEHRNYGVTHR